MNTQCAKVNGNSHFVKQQQKWGNEMSISADAQNFPFFPFIITEHSVIKYALALPMTEKII